MEVMSLAGANQEKNLPAKICRYQKPPTPQSEFQIKFVIHILNSVQDLICKFDERKWNGKAISNQLLPFEQKRTEGRMINQGDILFVINFFTFEQEKNIKGVKWKEKMSKRFKKKIS